MLSRYCFPESQTTQEVVKYTWLTLLAQAGVTLGLVMEVQHSFSAPWTQPFATLIISVVVLNQLLGPVCCRLGLQTILEAEKKLGSLKEDLELGSETSSDRSPSSPCSAVAAAAAPFSESDGSPLHQYHRGTTGMLQKLNQF